ncbi:MAG: amidophosphoribosyltransferase [Clostridia bacterium]|nr:amidophosphoribosyltransferase [Clostridia bacterium]
MYYTKPKEECGVFGIKASSDCAESVYYGLFALQHRGQESCGIAVDNGSNIQSYKNMGLVHEVFTPDVLSLLSGKTAIGHVRYSTTGASLRENAQPLVTKYTGGVMAIAHNGNLTNGAQLRSSLEEQGMMFQTTIDSESIAYVIAKECRRHKDVEHAVLAAMRQIHGAYSLLVMIQGKLIALRDEFGFRPLVVGTLDDGYVVASETCALDAVGAKPLREVESGEMIVIDDDGLHSYRDNCSGKSHMCIFEYLYFARSDSVIAGKSIYEARREAGRLLARQSGTEADLVIGVPDSGIDAAIGYAEESGIPYGVGLIKNRYIGRTFIQPSQEMREHSVKLKLNVVADSVRGKRVVMIDDSIVRGTTCRRIVKMLKDAGAKEVHMRSSAPPFLYPCYFGTDIPSQDMLVSWNNTTEQVRRLIGADSLAFLDPDSLGEIITGSVSGYCDACFSANYPTAVPYRGEVRKR